MADLAGIPKSRWPAAIGLVALLAFALSWLQGRFDASDVKKAIALAMSHRPEGATHTVFEALSARGEGDPFCDGKVVSQLLGDVAVSCATPRQPGIGYEFRVLLDRKKPPRPANAAAEALVRGLAPAHAGSPSGSGQR